MNAILEKLRLALDGRQFQYKLCFRSPPGKAVLQDLAGFCRANVSVFDPDQRLTDIAIGRNEVWLRIQNHLQLTPDELWELSSGRSSKGD